MFDWTKTKTGIAGMLKDLKKDPVTFLAASLFGVAVTLWVLRFIASPTPPPPPCPGPAPCPGPVVTPEEKALIDGLRQGLGTLPAVDAVLAAMSAAELCKAPVSVVVVDAASTWSDYGGETPESTPPGIGLNRAARDDPALAKTVEILYVLATRPDAPEIKEGVEKAPDVIVLHRTAFDSRDPDGSIKSLLAHMQRNVPKGGTVPPVIVFSRTAGTDSVWAQSLRAEADYKGYVVPYQFREGKPWKDKAVPNAFVRFIERMGRAERCDNAIRTMRQGS